MLFRPPRLGRALASLLVLHLSLLAADLPCADHAANAREAALTASAGAAIDPPAAHRHHAVAMEDGGAASSTGAAEADAESCQASSAEQRCCDALASCEVQLAFADAVEPLGSSSRAALAGTGMSPRSGASAPDTPPPKA